MKKLLFLVVLVLVVSQNWNKFESFFQDESAISANGSEEVVLFATSWCGYCQQARDFFAENNIAYTEYDIERDSEARDKYNEYNARGVPLIIIRGKVLPGFDPRAIMDALK